MKICYLIRSVRAETLKLKGSLALLAAVLVPLVPAFVNFMMTMRGGIGNPVLGIDNPWSLFFLYALKLWVIFALPLIVSVLAALLADVDHRPKAWKQLFALPFPRSAIFASKWLGLAGMTLLSSLVFGAANLVGGILVALLLPESGMGLAIPVLEAFARPFVAWLLSLFIVSIHLWISLRWASFLVSVTTGFAASLSNIFLLSSSLYAFSSFSPWAMPAQAYDRWPATLIVSLVGAVGIFVLARYAFIQQEVY